MWTALLAVLLLTLALFLPIGPYRLFFESGGLYLHIDRSRQRPSTEAEQRTLQQYLLEPADLPGEGDTVKERLLALSSVTEKTKDFTYYDSAPIEDYFHEFLKNLPEGELKAECLLPILVDHLIRAGEMDVAVLHSDSKWFGMTYQEDKPLVAEALRRLHREGVYPADLRT